jgi:hypothetical protein
MRSEGGIANSVIGLGGTVDVGVGWGMEVAGIAAGCTTGIGVGLVATAPPADGVAVGNDVVAHAVAPPDVEVVVA